MLFTVLLIKNRMLEHSVCFFRLPMPPIRDSLKIRTCIHYFHRQIL